MQGFCQKLPNKHQGSQFNGAVFSTALPLHCWAELGEDPIFLNLIKSFDVYIYRGSGRLSSFASLNYPVNLSLTQPLNRKGGGEGHQDHRGEP